MSNMNSAPVQPARLACALAGLSCRKTRTSMCVALTGVARWLHRYGLYEAPKAEEQRQTVKTTANSIGFISFAFSEENPT